MVNKFFSLSLICQDLFLVVFLLVSIDRNLTVDADLQVVDIDVVVVLVERGSILGDSRSLELDAVELHILQVDISVLCQCDLQVA